MKIYVIYITFFSSYSAGQLCGDGLRAGVSGRSTNTKRIYSLIIMKIINAKLLHLSFFIQLVSSTVPWSRTHEKNKQEKETKVTFYKNKFLRFFYEYIFGK